MTTGTAPSLERDYATVTAGAGLLDRSARGKLDVTGPDAAEFLQGQVTNDVEEPASGQGCYAALLDPKAHILADMRILSAGPAELWLDTEPHALDAVLRHLRMYKIGRQVEISDRTAERAILSLLGPASAEVGGRAAAVAIPSAEHEWVDARVGDLPVRIVATRAGVDLMTATEGADTLRAPCWRREPTVSATTWPRSSASSLGSRATASTWARTTCLARRASSSAR